MEPTFDMTAFVKLYPTALNVSAHTTSIV